MTNGLLLGFMLAAGVLLTWVGWTTPPMPRRQSRSRLSEMLHESGMGQVTPGTLIAICLALGTFISILVFAISESGVIAVFLGVVGAFVPVSVVRVKQRRRRAELRSVWPDAIDHLASGIRAGLSLSEAIEQLGVHGPEPLRAPFQQFARNYRVSGSFGDSLSRLKDDLSDPVGDRVVESLRLAREVGGQDLGRLLRTLASFLRDDARTRGELESRQSWTVNAARLAVAAPWALLLLLSLRPEAVAAYDSTAGVVVLTSGAVVSVVAYRLMIRLGRLPVEERVLR